MQLVVCLLSIPMCKQASSLVALGRGSALVKDGTNGEQTYSGSGSGAFPYRHDILEMFGLR